TELRRFEGHSRGTVLALAFSPDGRRALSGSIDKTMRLWEVETGKELRRFPELGDAGWFISVAFSRDGRRALTGHGDNHVRLWDVETGRELRRFVGHTQRIEGAVFS